MGHFTHAPAERPFAPVPSRLDELLAGLAALPLDLVEAAPALSVGPAPRWRPCVTVDLGDRILVVSADVARQAARLTPRMGAALDLYRVADDAEALSHLVSAPRAVRLPEYRQ